LGCGHGTLVHFAQLAGYANAKGVDVSEQQVALANKLGIANISQGDLMATLKATQPASLDVVIAFDVIEHFTKDELIDLVDAIHLALKPNGCWIIHTPNANSPFVGAVRYGDFTHEQAFTPTSIQQLLKASGFSRFIFAECGPRVHGLKSLVRVILWRLVRGVLNLVNAAETGDAGSHLVWTRNFYSVAYK
jgi:cyclopropane fatty-acyl-phospholipid synthase-like methyltransferase